jgi:hypothetical protein
VDNPENWPLVNPAKLRYSAIGHSELTGFVLQNDQPPQSSGLSHRTATCASDDA